MLLQIIKSLIGGTIIGWIAVRICVNVVGSIIEVILGEQLPLGDLWVNLLCLGLGMMCAIIYLLWWWRWRLGKFPF